MEPSFRARAALEGLGQLLEPAERPLIHCMAPAMLATLREALAELEGQTLQAVPHRPGRSETVRDCPVAPSRIV